MMPSIVRNTPTLLIPKELFKEDKIQEYWSVLHPVSQLDNIGKDNLGNFYLLYPKPNDADSIHEINNIYIEFQNRFPNHAHAVCVNVYEKSFNLLVIKDKDVAYTGYFHFSVKEDILYHLINISQHFFEDISQVVLGYQQLSPAILRLLSNYYEMKKI
jgi:hypothetical protein